MMNVNEPTTITAITETNPTTTIVSVLQIVCVTIGVSGETVNKSEKKNLYYIKQYNIFYMYLSIFGNW